MNFSKEIISWYTKNKRDLPWRNTSNPYYIWISEVILQQTRVNQGIAYYEKFIENFPDVFSLARANEDKVLRVWQGLGYYSRARNMHAAAKQIVKEYKGNFPISYEDIIALKGIGDYTAAAIASIAYNKAHAVVDGNVYRVLSRYYNIETPIDTSKGKKEFYALANEILDKQKPGVFNQALMELGAMVCTPKNPQCSNCCIQQTCYAYNNSVQESLPVKLKKLKIKKRYFFYFLINSKNKIVIHKRTEKDIWQGLYDLPLIELQNEISIEEAILQFKKTILNSKQTFTIKSASQRHTHKLSHQTIESYFINIELKDFENFYHSKYQIIYKERIGEFAFPILIANYLMLITRK